MAPATDGDNNEEHVTGGDGAWNMQEIGTTWRARGVQQGRQHNEAGLPIAQLIKKILIIVSLYCFYSHCKTDVMKTHTQAGQGSIPGQVANLMQGIPSRS